MIPELRVLLIAHNTYIHLEKPKKAFLQKDCAFLVLLMGCLYLVPVAGSSSPVTVFGTLMECITQTLLQPCSSMSAAEIKGGRGKFIYKNLKESLGRMNSCTPLSKCSA